LKTPYKQKERIWTINAFHTISTERTVLRFPEGSALLDGATPMLGLSWNAISAGFGRTSVIDHRPESDVWDQMGAGILFLAGNADQLRANAISKGRKQNRWTILALRVRASGRMLWSVE
jgi:hypothetical protein